MQRQTGMAVWPKSKNINKIQLNTIKKNMTKEQKFRTESDLLGTKNVPEEALYGVQTARAMENFHISGSLLSSYPNFIRGMAFTKKAAAMANVEVGMITPEQGEAIVWACDQLIDGKYHDQFPIDMIQGGAGTSTNMAANEVIANLALERMGHKRGEYQYCSPNDVVNASQSTNDAYPCAIHMALALEHLSFMPHLEQMITSLDAKSKEFAHVIKMGRTQLQDAVPMTLGQSFGAFADSLRGEYKNLRATADEFLVVNMGATAIGTGICSKPGYSEACIKALRKVTGWNITLADNLIEATSATTCMIAYSAAMKRLAIKTNKICNDLRLLSSGPRCGLNEIHLPEPVIAYTLFESIHLLENGYDTLRTLCIDGIRANEERCRQLVEHSIGIVTMLNPIIGYKQSTKIAKEASETGRGVYELVLEHGLLTKEQLDRILKPENMLKPVEIDLTK